MPTADPTLARRAVACAGWRWLPGMLASIRTKRGHTPARVLDVDDRGIPTRWRYDDVSGLATTRGVESGYGSPGWCEDVWSEARPDFDDPATLVCLLALAREAWGDPTLCAIWTDAYGGGWAPAMRNWAGWHYAVLPWDDPTTYGSLWRTEAAALVAALEAAPGVRL